jgi:hypothetical protein
MNKNLSSQKLMSKKNSADRTSKAIATSLS